MKKKEKQVALALAIIIIVAAAIAAYEIISARPSKWQIDDQLSNNGPQDTTEFTMNNTWAIAWKINKQNNNLFTVAVYMKNGTGYSWLQTTAKQTQTRHKESHPCPTQAPSSSE